MIIFKSLLERIVLFFRKIRNSLFSNNNNVTGRYKSYQPVVLRGAGKIIFGQDVSFGRNVNIGVVNSPQFFNTYAYIEARTVGSSIVFGNNIKVNNGFSVVSEKRITISDNVLIGTNCQIIDSTFHDLSIVKRCCADPNPREITIKQNVFIANNVTILKGVTIGENSVVATGAVVTKSFPENVLIAGVPAKIIRQL